MENIQFLNDFFPLGGELGFVYRKLNIQVSRHLTIRLV